MSQSANTYDVYLPKAKQKVLQKFIVSDINNKLAETEKSLVSYFKTQRWWTINNGEAILDNQTGLLWQGNPKGTQYKYDQQDTASMNIGHILGLLNWKLPTALQLEDLVKGEPKFPLRKGEFFEINSWWAWLTADKKVAKLKDSNITFGQFFERRTREPSPRVLTAYSRWAPSPREEYNEFQIAKVIAVNASFKDSSYVERINTFLDNGWDFKPFTHQEDSAYKAFLMSLSKYKLLLSLNSKEQLDILTSWKNIDYFSVRLPVIDAPVFTDNHKGLWEFYAPQSQQHQFNKVQSETSVRGRNPSLDIQHAPVAIDFGTSSTVVAIRQNGRDELLRIGIQEKDLNKAISAEQFENPTILEFLNLNEFQTSWQSEAYRPLVNWDHVHCSHEAKASLNNNKEADSKVISSIFPRLKQWALRDTQQTKVVITDQKGTEYTIQPLTEYNPVKGQAIQINQNYPELDPIELYAWFLGMNINWRGRGIFLDYYMTFPVAYPIEVKNKILASFRRGLMRSLPESLIADEQFNQFSVREWASEPAAYAAAALEKLNIEPTEQGVAYAVFDFGGGTTDFDYGIYREPNEQEEDLYDHVIEHFGASGDKFLGGENLLENLAYIVFKYNQEICRKQKVSFTKPLDAEKFIGHEQLIDDSQMAYTNTSLLMAALRPFLEKGQFTDGFAGALDIKLLNRQNEVVNCQFTVKQDELLSYLKSRIYQGFVNFFVELKQAFTTQHQALPKVIHILLAGNASRSKLVKELLVGIEKKDQTQTTRLNLSTIFGQDIPEFKIHYPLDADLKHHDVITAKTGVALGLLRLCPGEGLKVINHAKTNDDANSPFQFYVGRQKRGVFEVMIKRGDAYHQWQQIGAVSEDGIFLLLYSSLAQALTDEGMKRGATGLFDQRIRFAGNTAGQKVFARILAPSEIELCSATDLDEIQVTGGNNLQQIKLS
ncbi:hypothetical protein [Acinetobacter junii]|uniref:Molecular chaperone DnaK n=1 Tax=Acinetobacter junii TaxID=40215 RepID=A0AAW5R972_ACIJU|nr:hypothetical protein [Acinetobacter junii]MCU4397283.1 hypothetical protein [Acinetobacter junii]MDU2408949.1 hypothetical protein [Acinetobacter junii]